MVDVQRSFHTALSRASDAPRLEDLEDLEETEEEMRELRKARAEQHAEDTLKLEELRRRFAADAADPKMARWFEFNDLLRFVRARQDLDESEGLLRKAIAWRREREKAWGDDLADGSFGYLFAKYMDNKKDAPDWWAFIDTWVHATMYGDDEFGAPITYVHFGKSDMTGVCREVGEDALLRFMVYLTDYYFDGARSAYKEQEEGSGDIPVHGGIVILDMDGLAWRHKGDIGCFKAPGEVAKFLHPERQRRSFIVRAPRIFSMVWGIISPMIDARAREKMQIIGHGNSMQPLFEELGHDLTPKCLGGTMPDVPERPSGLVPQGEFARFQQTRERERSERQRAQAAAAAANPAAVVVASSTAAVADVTGITASEEEAEYECNADSFVTAC